MVTLKRLAQADTQLFNWLFGFTVQKDCTLILMMSRTGDGYLYLAIGALLWAFEHQYGALFLYTALMAYALELPLFIFLKNTFKRARPADLLDGFAAHIQPSDKFSLPSGHTAAAFLMATIVATFYPAFAILAFVWASLIGLSRVLLGVHFPGDVLLGATLGISIALISINLLA